MSAPWPTGILLSTDQGVDRLLVIAAALGLALLVLVFWFTASERTEDHAGDRERRWYPRLKF